MSSYVHNLYEYDETENENEMRIHEALDLQMPTNMKYENMKTEAQNDSDMNTEYISEYLNINPSKMNEWIMYKTAIEKYMMNRLCAAIPDHSQKTMFFNIFHCNSFVSQHTDSVLAHGEAATSILLEYTHAYHLCNLVLPP